eukprot:2035251-Prorocentrum_lima.AAC.1
MPAVMVVPRFVLVVVASLYSVCAVFSLCVVVCLRWRCSVFLVESGEPGGTGCRLHPSPAP